MHLRNKYQADINGFLSVLGRLGIGVCVQVGASRLFDANMPPGESEQQVWSALQTRLCSRCITYHKALHMSCNWRQGSRCMRGHMQRPSTKHCVQHLMSGHAYLVPAPAVKTCCSCSSPLSSSDWSERPASGCKDRHEHEKQAMDY